MRARTRRMGFFPMKLELAALIVAVMGSGCAKSLPPLPLRPEPIAWADTLPIPEPESREEGRILRTITVHVPYDLSEDVRVSEGEALNRTHFDDAVSSAWWERRIGYRDISPDELARGPLSRNGAPDVEGTLKVRSAKADGVTPGFVMEDAKGDVYIVKVDPAEVPYLQSSVGIIGNRLMWGAGYWVPEDYVGTLDPARLTLAEGAEIDGTDQPLTMNDVQKILTLTKPLPDGRVRFVASKFVPGKPKGPSFFSGVRKDDPNDHFRHEHRRELRGLRVISAWLNDTDRREGNTLDVYVAPGYLRHYQIDFAAGLGSGTDRPKHPKDDVERPADLIRAFARLASFGVYREGWEDMPHPVVHSALGFVKVEDFEPDEWKSAWDNPAFFSMSDADAYWGAKIVSSFTEAHIRAVVTEGQLPEPWLADTLTHVLMIRRDKVVGRYFSSVTPLEEPKVQSASAQALSLSFQDLGIDKGIWAPSSTRYEWSLSHPARGIESSGGGTAKAGMQQLDITWSGGSAGSLQGEESLAVLRVLAVRDKYYQSPPDPRAATVWLRWNASAGRYEVVGLEH
jgi:hypothetical protein